jgi:hypothetical protein
MFEMQLVPHLFPLLPSHVYPTRSTTLALTFFQMQQQQQQQHSEGEEAAVSYLLYRTTTNVLGFCRAGVGGYDVWTPGAATALIRREGVLGGATINRMNFQAVLDYLQLLVAQQQQNEKADGAAILELHIGCFAVAGLLSGAIPRRRTHVRDICDRVGALVLALAPRFPVVRFIYTRGLDPPRTLVGHARPDKKGREGAAAMDATHPPPK